MSRAALLRLLATCLQHPLDAVRRALDDGGTLARSSLLWVDSNGTYAFGGKPEMLDGLPDDLTVEHDNLLGLLRSSIVRAPEPGLTLADYPHLAEDIEIARGYLRAAASRRLRGVNVLLHGRPGTGKTELVRALVRAIGGELLEIPVEEPGGASRAPGSSVSIRSASRRACWPTPSLTTCCSTRSKTSSTRATATSVAAATAAASRAG